MHAWYQLKTLESPRDFVNGKPAVWRGLALVEAVDEAHARALGADLGAAPGQLYVQKLEPSAKRPLKKRFRQCKHCQFLKDAGY